MANTISSKAMNLVKCSAVCLGLASMSVTVQAEPPQRLIVKYKNTVQETNQFAMTSEVLANEIGRRHGANLKYLRKMALKNSHVMRFDKHQPANRLNKLIMQMQSDPEIESVEVDALMKPMYVPNDPLHYLLWHYFETTGGANVEAAWDVTDGSGITVAVLDTGYTAHADLVGNLLPGYDFISDSFIGNDGNGRDSDASDPGDWTTSGECGAGSPAQNSSWHGTHVAGTIAAVTDNNQGISGVAYGAKIVPVRVLGKCGGYLSDIADGVIWASGGSVSGVPSNPNPAQVINMSLGGGGACGTTYQNAINQARANGSVVVVAAGNSADNANNYRPASCGGVISVAANDRQGNLANYSNYGTSVDVSAPGGETGSVASDGVGSTLNSGTTSPAGDSYVYYQGTSMAAPHVAGVAALVLSMDNSLTPNEVESIIKNTTRPLPGSCTANGCGTGIVDARAAVDAAGGSTPSNSPPTSSFTYVANDLSVSFNDGSSDADGSIASWSWNFGDGTGSSAQNPSHTFDAGGSYTVQLTVTDDDGATNTSSQIVEVVDPGLETNGGFTETNINVNRRQWVYYAIDVPANADVLQVQISGGSGDADLYVRYGSTPTTRNYNCRPYLNGNNETCTFNNPTAGTWYIGIRGYRTSSGVRLDAYWQDN